MESEKNSNLKYFYPICREVGCNGILKIFINEINFTIDYECEKNKNHKGKGILFKTFESFYLKEKLNEKCIICALNLENNYIFKCKQCDQNYCSSCFYFDQHIKKCINNLQINMNKCNIHQRDLTKYCIDCGKKICFYCLYNSSENNIHKNHKIVSTLDFMPSNSKIDSLNNKLKDKILVIDDIINSIDTWEKKFLKKLETLKLNLKNEIKLLEKIFSNFDKYSENYTYYINFSQFENDESIINNESLEKFYESLYFEDQSRYIMEVICQTKKVIQKEGILDKQYEFKDGIITKLDENIFLNYYNKTIDLDYYNEDEDSVFLVDNSCIKFNEIIHSISFSKAENKIFVCLENKKTIKIFDYIEYSFEKKEIKLNKEEIRDNSDLNGHFERCICISKDSIASIDDNNKIYIWGKDKNDSDYYNKKKTIKVSRGIIDIILVNDDYLAFNQYYVDSLIFININKDFKVEKEIKNIDSIKNENCLFLLKDFIVVNCLKGLAVISIKTKEMVQYIENNIGYKNKTICTDNEDNIYILNNSKNLELIKMALSDGIFVIKEEYKNIELENDKSNDSDESKSSDSGSFDDLDLNMIYNRGYIILWNKFVYVLKEKNK